MDLQSTESRSERILQGRAKTLQDLASGAPLDAVLMRLALSAEESSPGLRCSVMLLDEEHKHLRSCVAPALPKASLALIDGLEIGPHVGSCGAAAFHGERVVVADVHDHPNWTEYGEFIEAAGISACWSEPILSQNGVVLGTFAMYYDEPREPTPAELEFIENSAEIAGLAIERNRDVASLRHSEELFRQLAENVREVFWLTDWVDQVVLYVSPAYETVWGRSCQSLYDDPKSWSYDLHPEDRAAATAAFGQASSGAYDLEYRIIRPDGEIRWIHDRAFPVYDREGRAYRVAGLSEDMTERKNVEQELRQARDELEMRRQSQVRSLTSDLLLAEERERRQLAIDLHDGLNQTVTLAQIKLGELIKRADPELQPELEDLFALVRTANQSVRSLTFQLSPPILHDLGFEPAVQWLVEDVQKTYGLTITFQEAGGRSELDERVRVLLYRAVRELLINVAKHARATSARVSLERGERTLRISVEDDGVAFDPTVVGTRGIGLSSIRERLSHLGGQMEIRSAPGTGTTATLEAPLAAQASPGESA